MLLSYRLFVAALSPGQQHRVPVVALDLPGLGEVPCARGVDQVDAGGGVAQAVEDGAVADGGDLR